MGSKLWRGLSLDKSSATLAVGALCMLVVCAGGGDLGGSGGWRGRDPMCMGVLRGGGGDTKAAGWGGGSPPCAGSREEKIFCVLRGGQGQEEGEGGRGEGGKWGALLDGRINEILRAAGAPGGGGTRLDALGGPPLVPLDEGRLLEERGELYMSLPEALRKRMEKMDECDVPRSGDKKRDGEYQAANLEEMREEARVAGGDGLPPPGPLDDHAVFALLRQGMRDEMPEDATWADYGRQVGKGRYAEEELGYGRHLGKTVQDLREEDPEGWEESDHVEGDRWACFFVEPG